MPHHRLYLLGHADLATRPDRTERALRVFFPRTAADYLLALQRGEQVLVREDSSDALGQLAAHLSAQGFRCSVRAPAAEMGTS